MGFFLDTAKESSSSKYVIGAIIGGVIGGLVLITTCIAIYCWCVCRRKPSQGRVLNPTPGYPGKYKNVIKGNNFAL